MIIVIYSIIIYSTFIHKSVKNAKIQKRIGKTMLLALNIWFISHVKKSIKTFRLLPYCPICAYSGSTLAKIPGIGKSRIYLWHSWRAAHASL
jgi:hypothetical protein